MFPHRLQFAPIHVDVDWHNCQYYDENGGCIIYFILVLATHPSYIFLPLIFIAYLSSHLLRNCKLDIPVEDWAQAA